MSRGVGGGAPADPAAPARTDATVEKAEPARADARVERAEPASRAAPGGGGLESLKTALQIGALIVGGLWTYGKFFATEAPLFSARGKTGSQLVWEASDDPGHCRASFQVTFDNIGSSRIRIEKAVVSSVRFELDQLELADYPEFLDVTALDRASMLAAPEAAGRSLKRRFSQSFAILSRI